MMKPRASSDLTMAAKSSIDDMLGREDSIENSIENKNLRNARVNSKSSLPDRPRAHSDLEPSSSLDSASVEPMKSFGKLSRTLSARASSLKGQVASGAQTVATGTQKVAHGVVTHTRSAADHIQTGIQTSAKVVASVPGSLVSVTDSIVNVGSGLVDKGQSGVMEAYDSLLSSLGEESQERSPMAMKREKSLATLESLCQRTQQAREQSSAANKDSFFTNVLGQEEFCQVDRRKKRKRVIAVNNGGSTTYSDRSSISSYTGFDDEQCAFGNKRKREFWFAVPQKRVDAIYHFLLHWSPEKYGQEQAKSAEETNILLDNSTITTATATSTAPSSSIGANSFESGSHNSNINSTASKHSNNNPKSYSSNRGFVVLDADTDDSLTVNINAPMGANNSSTSLAPTASTQSIISQGEPRVAVLPNVHLFISLSTPNTTNGSVLMGLMSKD
uniref:Uncharacterized protein n=1 Tax=Ditylenchus dipsaci TaxID=166011 RepID=A0A915CWE6_9BILA